MYELYLVINQINEKIYIGKTTIGLAKRWKHHVRDCKRKRNRLYAAMRKYGANRFSVHHLSFADTPEDLNRSEAWWIAKLNSRDPEIGYNMTAGGDGVLGICGKESALYIRDLPEEDVVRRYVEGETVEQLAEEFGVCESTIASRLKSAGVMRTAKEASLIRTLIPEKCANFRRDISTDHLLEMFRQGLTYEEISKRVGLNPETVSKRVRKRGVDPKIPRQCSEQDKQEMADLYAKGYSTTQISKVFSCASRTVSKYLRAMGTAMRPFGSCSRTTPGIPALAAST